MIVEDVYSDVKEMMGICSEEKVFNMITDVIALLSKKGDWNPLIGIMDICASTDCCTITLPRDVETPLGVNVGGFPRQQRNWWYEFHLNGNGSNAPSEWHWDDKKFYPTAFDLIKASRLVAVADAKTDASKKIRVYGFDKNNKFIRTQQPDGTWIDGFDLPVNIANDFPSLIIQPDTERLDIRNIKTVDITELNCNIAHDLTTGAGVILALLAAPMPAPLVAGTTYFVRVPEDDTDTVSLHNSRSGALTNTDKVTITSAENSSQVSLSDVRGVQVQTKFTSSIPHNIKTGTLIEFEAIDIPSPLSEEIDYYANKIDDSNFTAHETLEDAEAGLNPIDVTTPGSAVTVKAKQEIDPITHLDFSVNHNFLQGDAVVASNPSGQLPEPLLPGVTYFVRYVSGTRITLHFTLADANNGVNAIVFTSSGSGTSSIVKTIAASANTGTTNNINCTAHNLADDDLVQFSTTGVLPTPLAQNTVYKVETPLATDIFTIVTTAPAAINITAVGSGQLFVIISRAFTIGFTNRWRTDAENITTGSAIKFDTTGTLPSTSPSLSTSTTYYARKIDEDSIEVYDTKPHAEDLSATTGRVTVSGVATGTTYLVLERSITAQVFDDPMRFVDPATSEYFKDGATIRFTTTGTLPGGLSLLTDYKGYIEDGLLRIKTSLGANVDLTNIGTGDHSMSITRNFTISLPTSFEVLKNIYEDGDKVTFKTTDTVPTPIVANADYWVRRISDDLIELYDSEVHAKDTASTTGRIVARSTGEGDHTLQRFLAAFEVKEIIRLLKDKSDSFIDLYAWDDGRDEQLTLLGHYYPDETEPSYRRIQVGASCTWVRIRYRRRPIKIASKKDWIPLSSKEAILMMTKAVTLKRKNFLEEGKAFEKEAEHYLSEEKQADDGPDVSPIQVSNDSLMNTNEQWMT